MWVPSESKATGLRQYASMPPDEQERASQRDLVRAGYDAISYSYRGDNETARVTGIEGSADYRAWVDELGALLRAGARVLDLGCGAGIPATKLLTDSGFAVVGVDFSEVQIARARTLVPDATFDCADIVFWDSDPASFDAVVSLYTLIICRSKTSGPSSLESPVGFDRMGICWQLSGTESGRGLRITWAPQCSGNTPIPPPISHGLPKLGYSHSGIASFQRKARDTRWCSRNAGNPGPVADCP